MYRSLLIFICFLLTYSAQANRSHDNDKVKRAVLDYIESQHEANPELMKRGLDKKLAKRTYWQAKDGAEFVMESSYDTMVEVAKSYNKDGDKFPKSPKVIIDIFDVDKRIASVKLTVDDWVDYMHLYKNEKGEWKVINVLWQLHDIEKHSDE